eukprot:828696-Rhodomonas_salina.3
MTSEFRAIVGDVSLTHPYIGDADEWSTWGNYKADHVTRRIDDKNSKYMHHVWNHMRRRTSTTVSYLSSSGDELIRHHWRPDLRRRQQV